MYEDQRTLDPIRLDETQEHREERILKDGPVPFVMVKKLHPEWSDEQIKKYILEKYEIFQRGQYEEQMTLWKALHPELTEEQIHNFLMEGKQARVLGITQNVN